MGKTMHDVSTEFEIKKGKKQTRMSASIAREIDWLKVSPGFAGVTELTIAWICSASGPVKFVRGFATAISPEDVEPRPFFAVAAASVVGGCEATAGFSVVPPLFC